MSQPVPLPSDRKFGLLFFGVFAALSVFLWWRGRHWQVTTGISAAFLLAALLVPVILHPLNRAWMAFAELLHKVTSPIILGVLFFALFTPVAFFMRLRKRDAMKLRLDPSASTYWIPRSPAGPAPESLRDQY